MDLSFAKTSRAVPLRLDEESVSETRSLHLVECCDTPRGRGVISTIVVKPSPGNDFVTIHDYLSTLHPFLLASRESIVAYQNMLDMGDGTDDPKLMVDHNGLNDLMILLEDQDSAWWKNSERRTHPSKLVDDDWISATEG